MNISKRIEKGDTVKYKDGYYRVSALFTNTVNLCSIFSKKIHHKKVPLTEVVEAKNEWYEKWGKSETYKSM